MNSCADVEAQVEGIDLAQKWKVTGFYKKGIQVGEFPDRATITLKILFRLRKLTNTRLMDE